MRSVSPQGLVLELALLSIFVDDVDKKIECTPRNSADDTRLSHAVGTLKGWDAIQMNLNSLETKTYANLMKFYKVKCPSSLIFSNNMCLK